MRQGESEVVLVKNSEWSAIDGEPCRVTEFSPEGSIVDSDGRVRSVDRTRPYAIITMECMRLGKGIRGYITHKMDFQHLWAAFKERTIREDEEVIVIWTKKHYRLPAAKLLAKFLPKLWVMVCPQGALELMVDSSHRPELAGEARWRAVAPVADWKPEIME